MQKTTRTIAYEHSPNLPRVLERLGISLVVSTYQAGKVFTVGTFAGQLQVRFHHVDQAMGIARTPHGLAIASRQQIWQLLAGPPNLARQLGSMTPHDVCFLARESHFTGPIDAHDLAWCGDRLWVVNTLFNCLCTAEPPWSFVPRWRPPFIREMLAGDRCHLNGVTGDSHGPRYVTVLGEADEVDGWRGKKRHGGCLIDVRTGTALTRGLSMPHSPRLQGDRLFLLNSGHGRLERFDSAAGCCLPIAELPGYTRGLDLHGDLAFVGLSRIRETAVFGGLPLEQHHDTLQCGVSVVDLRTGQILANFSFTQGIDEIFDVRVLPGYRNPVISGPSPDVDETPAIWFVPSSTQGMP